jgi:hypothetical protein
MRKNYEFINKRKSLHPAKIKEFEEIFNDKEYFFDSDL